MMKRLLLNLTTASVLVPSARVSMAQTTPITTPTTKILAIGTFPPGTDMQLVQHILPTEVRETAQLYLEGNIDQWYSLQDRAGVAFILNVTDVGQAHEMRRRALHRLAGSGRTGNTVQGSSRSIGSREAFLSLTRERTGLLRRRYPHATAGELEPQRSTQESDHESMPSA